MSAGRGVGADDQHGLGARVAAVRGRIRVAAERADRDPSTITLVAVTKTHPASVVRAAIAAGLDDIGENRVQEAAQKRPAVGAGRWHLIGPLQRNKAAPALEHFDVVHTVDRQALVERLVFLLAQRGSERILPVFVQVNVGGEAQKAGVAPADAPALCRSVVDADGLELRGLMTIPPLTADPEGARPYFRSLRELRDRVSDELGAPLPELSMGMSADFEVAIEEGATIVRVGSALFGARPA